MLAVCFSPATASDYDGLAYSCILSLVSLETIDTSHEYFVADSRFHKDPDRIEVYYASNDLADAKLVANEAGFNFVFVRYDSGLDHYELVYDARFHIELALEP
jgi:hypothetical protein